MKKGLLTVLFLGFSVIALHAHNVGLAETSNNAALSKAVTSSVQQVAVEAEMEALAKADADWEVYRAVNQKVKNELYKIYKDNVTGDFSDDLMNIWINFKNIANGECWQWYFIKEVQSIGDKIAKISQKDENLANKVVAALEKGYYRYRHQKWLYEYLIPVYEGPMSFHEALQIRSVDVRQLHSAG